MSATRDITFKYLRFMSARGAVMAMTIISIIGIAIGVAALTTSLSVADGFGKAYKKAILDFNADVVLLSIDEIKKPQPILEKLEDFGEDIKGVSPFIYREGLLIYNGKIKGVVVKGVDLDASHEGTGRTPILLGRYLAGELGIKDGDEIRLMLPEHWKGESAGSFEVFRVAGRFETGMYDFDSQFALLDLKDAQQIFGAPDTVSGIEIKIADPDKAPAFAQELGNEFSYPIYATHWQELNRSLFEAVKLEKLMFIIVMGALVIVAAFNIVGTVMLRVLYKTSDISILRALGMNIRNIRRIFVVQGLFVGLIGTVLGVIVALALVWSLTRFEWVQIPQEIYLLSALPVCISWPTIIMISAFSLMICWLTSMVAAGRVLGLSIVRGLHRPC